jgi:positive regulator of sigma E activity
MKTEMRWVQMIVALISALGVLVALLSISLASNLTNRENAMLGVIVAILTTLASWLISRHYAIESNQQTAASKIDTVARQSTEKILNLSKQLFEIEDFLEEARELGKR